MWYAHLLQSVSAAVVQLWPVQQVGGVVLDALRQELAGELHLHVRVGGGQVLVAPLPARLVHLQRDLGSRGDVIGEIRGHGLRRSIDICKLRL